MSTSRKARPRTTVRFLMLSRLKESGLTAKDATALKLSALSPATTAKLSTAFRAQSAMRIPYYNADGSKVKTSGAQDGYYRIRYLGDVSGARYMQLPGSGVAAYFPRNLPNGDSWSKVLLRPEQPILLTEGELKAACATSKGFPTIGLGGVYSFRDARNGYALLPELSAITWAKRTVYIVFDSDYRSNPQVCAALKELANALCDRGALPRMVSLPEVPPGADDSTEVGKVGLDDFLVRAKPEDLRALLDESKPLTLSAALWALNKLFLYDHSTNTVIERRTGQCRNPRTMRDFSHAQEKHVDWVLKADGTVKLKQTSATGAWLKWSLRADVDCLTFTPGGPEIIVTEPSGTNGQAVGSRAYNTWRSWGVDPVRGSVKPFADLVDHIFCDVSAKVKDWFLDWCAYPLQNPGTKMYTSVAIFGVKHGTGKSLLGYTLGRIYGTNFAEITHADLHSSFNEWAARKQFVLADDVLSSNRRGESDVLKKMITQKQMRINTKYIATYVVPDCVNYFFTSNHPDAFFLEDDDRRFFVHEVTRAPLADSFYKEYDAWLNGDGPSALFYYLLRRKIGDFNPRERALATEAKRRMIEDGRSDVGVWIENLNENPKATMGAFYTGREIYTSGELLAVYDPLKTGRVSANGITREMKRQGRRLLYEGRTVNSRLGPGRYFALEREEYWLSVSHGELTKYLDSFELSPKQRQEKY